jgi:hypothetical protein
MQELFPKRGIAKEDLPPFLQTWLDHSSTDCMFSPIQLRTWTSAHLRGIAWYLECRPQHVHDLEVDIFKSLDVVSGVVAEDEALAGLDDKTCEKLIAQDKLKAEKVKDALEKTRLKEVERKKKQDDKAKEKAEKGKDKTEKGKDKKTNVQDEVTSTVLDEVLQPKFASNSNDASV